ncbi:Rid family detoxifying hydrolase [Psychrobacter sp. FDAARGOS_221]|uniref:Rid family detoxifying hydrolase n=1 Tax=Psychrobacter sp. FDAARGOS_221 TaxID=1975705 RepID=UPI000BB58B53|nr:Rid family detoxifying hydrolase [Psychrobacter sp. FDAARGOS_221]PNK60192.1 reactive intermediate/imine deaminase [Psychrobacter sp. FDAARGOS_221]
MTRQTIHTDKAPAAVGAYSQAVKIPSVGGSLVYISGQLGFDPETMELAEGFEAQAALVMDNIEAICEEAGGKLSDVVKFNVSLTDLNDFAALNAIFAERLSEPYPARAAVQVAALPKGGVVEIESILFIED